MRKVLLSLVIAILVTTSANAFDGNRKGFVLGGSVGLGYAGFGSTDCPRCERAESGGLQTALIIGAGLSDKTILSYTGLQFWRLGSSHSYSEVGYVLLPSVELRIFSKITAPSMFYGFGIGPTIYDNDGYTGGDNSFSAGIAPHAGAGYEFAKHWSVEARLAYTVIHDSSDDPMFGAMLLVTVLAY